MQVVKKILFGLLVSWFALIVFMPKEELYFSLERELAKQGIEINEGSIEESMFGLVLNNVTVYVRGIKIITIKKVSFSTYLIYSKVKMNELYSDKEVKSIVALHLEKAVLEHLIVSPLNISLRAIGNIGELTGMIALKDRKIHIDITDPKKVNSFKRFLKKSEKGWYYETAF